jgi:hypothetical protein
LMTADLSALAEYFHIEGGLRPGGWQLAMTPREAVGQWVSRIELRGDRHVDLVQLVEAGGDVTIIRFSRQEEAASLSPDEAVRFE